LTALPALLIHIDKTIIDLAEPVLPGRLTNQGKIKKRADARLIAEQLARTGFETFIR
jgi:hypothetical protein